MNRRQGGFTLIELLVVITILVMLMTLLLPAVLRARLLVLGILTQGQVTSLANACNAYYTIFEGYPGVFANPPATGGSSKVSGAQNLRLSLLGCSRNGQTYNRQYRGPANDMDTYGASLTHKHEIYDPRPEELLMHTSVLDRDSSQDGSYVTAEVFVDFRLTPAKALLYYRALPRQVDDHYFQFNDNSVYCVKSGETTDASGWIDTFTGSAIRSHGGFIIVSAGVDRQYFTSDDYANVAN